MKISQMICLTEIKGERIGDNHTKNRESERFRFGARPTSAMKLPRRWPLIALLAVPFALFFVARRASQVRPWKLGVHADCDSLIFSPDGKTLISSSFSNSTSVFWDSQNGQQLRQMTVDWVNARFSPDGQHLAWLEARTHGTQWSPIVLINSASGQREKCFPDPESRPADKGDGDVGIVWTDDGREIVVLTEHQVRRFDTQTGRVLSCFAYRKPFSPDDGSSFLSPDGKVMGYTENVRAPSIQLNVIILNTQTNTKLGVIVTNEPNSALNFSPKSRYFAIDGGLDVPFVRTSDCKRLWMWKGLNSGNDQTSLHFSADEKSVVLCNGSACIARDTQTGRELWRLKTPNSPLFALSPDGKTLAEARLNGQIFLWPLPQTS